MCAQVDVQTHISGHGKVRPLRERPDEREQLPGGVCDGEIAGGARGPAADERSGAVGGPDGGTAERDRGEVGRSVGPAKREMNQSEARVERR